MTAASRGGGILPRGKQEERGEETAMAFTNHPKFATEKEQYDFFREKESRRLHHHRQREKKERAGLKEGGNMTLRQPS